MKRMSLLFLSAVAALAVQAAITLTPGLPYSESFETDFAGWTQEYVVGTVDWTRDAGSPAQGGMYNGAYDGEKNLLFYFEDYGKTTRLVSPEFDLSRLANPLLSFYLANEKWSNDQDTLVVLVRNSAADPWTEVATIGQMSKWTLQNYNLPSHSATAQIAFEAQGHYGYGIAIDLVTVGEETKPAVPVITSAETRYTSILYSWSVSAMAEHSQYVLAYDGDLDDAQLESLAVDLPAGQTWFEATGLGENSSHWFYVRAVNGLDVSDWAKIYAYTLYRGVGLSITEGSSCATIRWNGQAYVDLLQMVVSTVELSDEDLAAYPSASMLTFLPSDPNAYEFYGEFGQSYHVYARFKYQDIGFGEWDHRTCKQTAKQVRRVKVFDVSTTGASLSWFSPTNVDGVIVSDNPDLTNDDLNAMTYATVNDATYLLTGLTPNQTVTVYISATLSDPQGRANWWLPVTLTTLPATLGPVVVTDAQPFVEDFETAATLWTSSHEKDGFDWFVGNGLHVGEYYEFEAYEGSQNYYFGGEEEDVVSGDLVSPVLDVSAVSTPRLSFYYINPIWSSDYNGLEVYYRVSPSDEWVLMQSFTSNIQSWTLFDEPLPEKSAQLQIKLHGINGYGYGFGVDRLMVKDAAYTQIDAPQAGDSGVKIFASAGCIHVLGAPAGTVVTTLIGQTVAVLADADEQSVQVPAGIYLVRAAGRTFKLLVP